MPNVKYSAYIDYREQMGAEANVSLIEYNLEMIKRLERDRLKIDYDIKRYKNGKDAKSTEEGS